jgi:hypothetical protein
VADPQFLGRLEVIDLWELTSDGRIRSRDVKRADSDRRVA